MKLTTIALTLLAAMATAFQVPSAEDSVETAAAIAPNISLATRDGPIFKCKGSILCKTSPGLVEYCKKAIETLPDGKVFGTSGGPKGNCWGNIVGQGCGVFVSGPRGCYRSSEQIKEAFKNIRAHKCGKCGWVENDDNRGDVCRIKVDYVTWCKNYDKHN